MPTPRSKRTVIPRPDGSEPLLEGSFTLYAMNGHIFRFNGLEDAEDAVCRLMAAWKTAEQCVGYSLFSAPDEKYLASAFAAENLGPAYIEETSHIDMSLLARSMTKADQAVVYVITTPSGLDRRFEAQIDVLESQSDEKKLTSSMSMSLSEFVRNHGASSLEQDALYRIAVDVGHYRLVHSDNLDLTLAKLEKAGTAEPYPSKSIRDNCFQQLIQASHEHKRRAGFAENELPTPSRV